MESFNAWFLVARLGWGFIHCQQRSRCATFWYGEDQLKMKTNTSRCIYTKMRQFPTVSHFFALPQIQKQQKNCSMLTNLFNYIMVFDEKFKNVHIQITLTRNETNTSTYTSKLEIPSQRTTFTQKLFCTKSSDFTVMWKINEFDVIK